MNNSNLLVRRGALGGISKIDENAANAIIQSVGGQSKRSIMRKRDTPYAIKGRERRHAVGKRRRPITGQRRHDARRNHNVSNAMTSCCGTFRHNDE